MTPDEERTTPGKTREAWGHTPKRRRTDRAGIVDKLNYAVSRYRVIVWGLVIAALAAGFDFKTPKQAMAEITSRQDSVHAYLVRRDSALDARLFRVERIFLLDAWERCSERRRARPNDYPRECDGIFREGMPR